MESEDVITLGSSDEDTEPAPKKSKTSIKPPPNAMVCIPRNINCVSIKHHKSSADPIKSVTNPGKSNPLQLPKGLGKGITVKKVLNPAASKTSNIKISNAIPTKVTNPYALKKINGKPITFAPLSLNNQKKPAPVRNQGNVISNSSERVMKSSVQPPTTASKCSKLNSPVPITTFQPIKGPSKRPLNILPSTITVKKATSMRPPIIYMTNTNIQINTTEEVTVLDDDEGSPAEIATASPQWYLRPEDQALPQETSTLEEQNNKEPEPQKMIEITIEDSPLKPIPNKRTDEIGAELAITIDDSPIKPALEKKATKSGSEDEEKSTIEYQSKKKLEYPKEEQSLKTVEIEIEPYIVNTEQTNTNTKSIDLDIEDTSNLDKKESNLTDTKAIVEDKKENEISPKAPVKKITPVAMIKDDKIETTGQEFHPVYQNFIDLCFELENSDDMKKIVDKKIKGYYLQVPKSYTESEEFIDIVSSKIVAMRAGPEKMYLYMKDIVDELNMQRKLAKSQVINKETKVEEPEPFMYGEESEYDSKRQRQIRKLEKTIKKLSRAIQKLEEQEVDFDDEDDSVYLLTERYKERMVRVYAKFCQLSNTKMPSEPRIHIDARPGQPAGPAKRLEKIINKKVPIGTPLPFPDFHDVLRCVREANEGDNLGWNEADIMEEARDLFTRCGRKMQRRRQENEWRLAASRIALHVDPAEQNTELRHKLDENKKLAATNENEIFKKYADRQLQLKLEGEEIGDKEAEESPVESEDEDANEDSVLLENKEKRKERLIRLLQEKSKKAGNGKENQPSKEPNQTKNETGDTSEKKEHEDTKTPVSETKDLNSETSEKPLSESVKELNSQNTETLTVSDDSNNLNSDIDELHLLQKLHSGKSESSSIDTSDSDSLIAISDSLESTDENKKRASDIISIENSSYSEGEPDEQVSKTIRLSQDSVQLINSDSQPDEEIDTTAAIDENEIADVEPVNKIINAEKNYTTNNEEYNELVEDILLASSGDENDKSQDSQENPLSRASINLKDDLISIEETVIEDLAGKPGKDSKKAPNDYRSQEIDENCNTEDSDVVEVDRRCIGEEPKEANRIQIYGPDNLKAKSDENCNTGETDVVDLMTHDKNVIDEVIDSSDIQDIKSVEKFDTRESDVVDLMTIDDNAVGGEIDDPYAQEAKSHDKCNVGVTDVVNLMIIEENDDVNNKRHSDTQEERSDKKANTKESDVVHLMKNDNNVVSEQTDDLNIPKAKRDDKCNTLQSDVVNLKTNADNIIDEPEHSDKKEIDVPEILEIQCDKNCNSGKKDDIDKHVEVTKNLEAKKSDKKESLIESLCNVAVDNNKDKESCETLTTIESMDTSGNDTSTQETFNTTQIIKPKILEAQYDQNLNTDEPDIADLITNKPNSGDGKKHVEEAKTLEAKSSDKKEDLIESLCIAAVDKDKEICEPLTTIEPMDTSENDTSIQ